MKIKIIKHPSRGIHQSALKCFHTEFKFNTSNDVKRVGCTFSDVFFSFWLGFKLIQKWEDGNVILKLIGTFSMVSSKCEILYEIKVSLHFFPHLLDLERDAKPIAASLSSSCVLFLPVPYVLFGFYLCITHFDEHVSVWVFSVCEVLRVRACGCISNSDKVLTFPKVCTFLNWL